MYKARRRTPARKLKEKNAVLCELWHFGNVAWEDGGGRKGIGIAEAVVMATEPSSQWNSTSMLVGARYSCWKSLFSTGNDPPGSFERQIEPWVIIGSE